MARAPRTPRQIVTVAGLEGSFLQVAVGRKNIRVQPAEGGTSFLVEAGKVSKVESSDDGSLPVREGMASKKRATYAGEIVVIVRTGKTNSRICEIGGSTTFLANNSELSNYHEEAPAVEAETADLVTARGEMITLTTADIGTITIGNPGQVEIL